ncbi:MAG: FAD-dependent oxidoreductase, partial [Pseudomonadota bacterium]
MSNSYDVIIIGSGPGGYVTAVRAAQLGLKTAIVEREHLGGICLNWGCIPTKALLRSAEILHFAEHADSYGLKLEGKVSADMGAVVQRSRKVSARLNGGVGFLMKKNKVDVIWGEARLTKATKAGAPAEVVVSKSTKKPMEPQHPAPKGTLGEGTYQAKHVIVATGALEIDAHTPEKSLKAITAEAMAAQFALNTIGPALCLRHASRLLPRTGPSVWATLSARVGSIGDNRLG